jgi:nicotinamide mononucleotide transporter
MIDNLLVAWQQVSALEIISVTFGLAYVVLAARENIWCWPAAFVGTGTGIFLFWDASLLMESGLNVFYLLMAVYGFYQWRYGGQHNQELAISSWQLPQHGKAILLIIVLAAGSGYLLNNYTNAALPFVDSFTSWAAVVSTWMVARKILENWLYWIVIDAVSVWLYVQRELYLYALLFVFYTVIAIYGYFQWQKKIHATD